MSDYNPTSYFHEWFNKKKYVESFVGVGYQKGETTKTTNQIKNVQLVFFFKCVCG